MRWYSEGIRVPGFQGFHAEELMAHFTSSPENAPIRAMLREWYGSTWTQRLFGFS